MQLYIYLVFNFCGIIALELFHKQEQTIIDSVHVELLWEKDIDMVGRDKRSSSSLPGQLAFQFSLGGDHVVLNLEKNPDLNAYPPAFVVRGGQVVPELAPNIQDNLGYYQDEMKGAAIMVKREAVDRTNYELVKTIPTPVPSTFVCKTKALGTGMKQYLHIQYHPLPT